MIKLFLILILGLFVGQLRAQERAAVSSSPAVVTSTPPGFHVFRAGERPPEPVQVEKGTAPNGSSTSETVQSQGEAAPLVLKANQVAPAPVLRSSDGTVGSTPASHTVVLPANVQPPIPVEKSSHSEPGGSEQK